MGKGAAATWAVMRVRPQCGRLSTGGNKAERCRRGGGGSVGELHGAKHRSNRQAHRRAGRGRNVGGHARGDLARRGRNVGGHARSREAY